MTGRPEDAPDVDAHDQTQNTFDDPALNAMLEEITKRQLALGDVPGVVQVLQLVRIEAPRQPAQESQKQQCAPQGGKPRPAGGALGPP